MPQDFFSQRACTACTLLPSPIVRHNGDSTPASLASHRRDTPPPSPGSTASPHSCHHQLPAAGTLLLPLVTLLHCCPPITASQVSCIRAIRRTPIFLSNLGGVSYSPKNMVLDTTFLVLFQSHQRTIILTMKCIEYMYMMYRHIPFIYMPYFFSCKIMLSV